MNLILRALFVVSILFFLTTACTPPGTTPEPVYPEIGVFQDLIPVIDGTDNVYFGTILADGEGLVTSADFDFTVENSGDANLTVSLSILSGDKADFEIVTSLVSPVLETGTTSFTLRFDPLTTGDKAAIVQITNNDPDENPFTFTVSGTASATAEPEISVVQGTTRIIDGITDYSFGNFGVDGDGFETSETAVFTVRNDGSADMTLNMSVTGGDTSDFEIVTSPAVTVAGSGSTTFGFLFDPVTLGGKSIAVEITNNDSNENPFTFNISGTGVTLGNVFGRVVDSAGGGAVASADVTMPSHAYTATTDANGEFTITNVVPGRHDIVIGKSGFAGSKIQSVLVESGLTSKNEFILPELNFPAAGLNPPTIAVTGIVPNAAYSGSVRLAVSVTPGSAPVVATSTHASIQLFIGGGTDYVPTTTSMTDTMTYKWNTAQHPSGTVNVKIVAYDNNNNRSELTIPVTVSGSLGSAPSLTPTSSYYQVLAMTYGENIRLYGVEQDYARNLGSTYSVFSAAPNSTVYVQLDLRRVSNTTGFTVYRSTASTGPFNLVGSTTYAYNNTSDGNDYYRFIDFSSDLASGQVYYYQLCYFNSYGAGPVSGALSTRILPRFTLNLTTPANNSVILDTTPTLRWSATSISYGTRYDTLIIHSLTRNLDVNTITMSGGSASVTAMELPKGELFEWNMYSYYRYSNSTNVISLSLPSDSDASSNGSFYFSISG